MTSAMTYCWARSLPAYLKRSERSAEPSVKSWPFSMREPTLTVGMRRKCASYSMVSLAFLPALMCSMSGATTIIFSLPSSLISTTSPETVAMTDGLRGDGPYRLAHGDRLHGAEVRAVAAHADSARRDAADWTAHIYALGSRFLNRL